MHHNKPTLVVAGAGIAGLAIAEIFQRSGWKVTLFERNSKICQEASAMHQSWFHFGSLYQFSGHEVTKVFIENYKNVIQYYSSMPGMNLLSVDTNPILKEAIEPWFVDDIVHYAIKKLDHKDNSFIIPQHLGINQPLFNIDHVPGLDRPMNFNNIIKNLLSSFITHGGQLHTNCNLVSFKNYNECVELSIISDIKIRKIVTKKLILTTGKDLQRIRNHNINVNIVESPMIVTYPHLSPKNFVLITNNNLNTINHFKHTIDNKDYSVIGSALSIALDASIESKKLVLKSLQENAQKCFSKFQEVNHDYYVGCKVEIIDNSQIRNYSFEIRKIEDNIFIAVPGKASLSFSLAISFFKILNNNKEPQRLSMFNENIDLSPFVDDLCHVKIARKLMNKRVSN
ncbi:MAG: FAD-dependent oxidoreductase [Chthoniobacterales bacterium]